MKDNISFATCLWFDSEAEEAANFYISVFPKSKILSISRYDAASAIASGRPEGSVLTVVFELNGQKFMGLNGGPIFKFSEAVSIMVDCDTQEEIDYYWNTLTADGGQESACGWLKDKFGFSWQIVPREWEKLINHPDKEKAGRAMQAMLTMRKLDIAELKRACDGN
jgi:predicted 3-demethylubiquinone-9 3-methyltransferase (glyoxalase superfamily)